MVFNSASSSVPHRAHHRLRGTGCRRRCRSDRLLFMWSRRSLQRCMPRTIRINSVGRRGVQQSAVGRREGRLIVAEGKVKRRRRSVHVDVRDGVFDEEDGTLLVRLLESAEHVSLGRECEHKQTKKRPGEHPQTDTAVPETLHPSVGLAKNWRGAALA